MEYYPGGDDGCLQLSSGSVSRPFTLSGHRDSKFQEGQSLSSCDFDEDAVAAIVNYHHLAFACAQALDAAQLLRERTLQSSLRGSWIPTAGAALLSSEMQLKWFAPGEAAPTQPGMFCIVLHGELHVQGIVEMQMKYCIQQPPQLDAAAAVEQFSVSDSGDWNYTLRTGGSLGLQLLR
jgi:hypothetical protein